MAFASMGVLYLRDHQRLGLPGVRVGRENIYDSRGKILSETGVILPETVAGLKSTASPITDFELSLLPKDTTFGRRVYSGPDNFLCQLSVVLMGTDRTSIHRPEQCLPGQGWQIQSREIDQVHFDRPAAFDLPVQKLSLRISGTSTNGTPVEMGGVYVYWFVADGLVTASHSERMLWMARDLVWKRVLDRWAYVSYFVPCQAGRQEEAFAYLKKIIAASAPLFQTAFPEARPPLHALGSAP